jgi:GTP-binding protein HflX
MAEDLLFATLDPTLREIRLPGFDKAILSDTVGFVSDLPTELVAAFRATLEEVVSADLILQIRDMAHPDSDAQAADVGTILENLGLKEDSPPRLEVWNKIDALEAPDRAALLNEANRRDDVIAISALTGEGIERLRDAISQKLQAGSEVHRLSLPASAGERLAWLHSRGEVLDEQIDGDMMQLAVRLSPDNWARFQAL